MLRKQKAYRINHYFCLSLSARWGTARGQAWGGKRDEEVNEENINRKWRTEEEWNEMRMERGGGRSVWIETRFENWTLRGDSVIQSWEKKMKLKKENRETSKTMGEERTPGSDRMICLDLAECSSCNSNETPSSVRSSWITRQILTEIGLNIQLIEL